MSESVDLSRSVRPRVHRTKLVHIMTIPESLQLIRGQPRYMCDRGYDVYAVASPGPTLNAFGHQEGIQVHGIDMARRITPLRDLIAVAVLRQWLREARPCIVHAHTPKAGLVGMIASWFARVPVRVYHIHGLPFVTARGVKRPLLMASEWVSCHLATQVLCVSPSIRDLAVRARLCPPARAKVLLSGTVNGVDAQGRFNPRTRRAEVEAARRRLGLEPGMGVIGFVGRIVADKGIGELEAAWRVLRRDYLDLHLLLVGPVEEQDPVPGDIMQAFANDPRVHLTGAVDDPAAFYGVLDVLVLPSYREGFGLATVEAAAMTRPVVATRIPGCVDAVDNGRTGILVPPRDAAALDQAIRVYLDDPQIRIRHGEAGRRRVVEMFAQSEMWAAVHAEYSRLCSAERVP